MEATVIVAGMGFVATLTGAWLTGRSQRQAALEGRILDAKVRVFGACADTLYEYERATFNRVKARLASQPDARREELRQEAYRQRTSKIGDRPGRRSECLHWAAG